MAKKSESKRSNLNESAEAVLIAADLAKCGSSSRSHKIGVSDLGHPSDIQLAWYHEWTVRHRSLADIAREAGVTRSAVHQGVHKAKEWIKLEVFNDILDFRHRHTETLEVIASQALVAWGKSKEIGVTEEFESVTVDGETEDDLPRDATKTKRKEVHQCGSASFLDAARSALSDIRSIWGVDMPAKMAMSIAADEEIRLAGGPLEETRRDYALKQIANLKKVIESQE